MDPALQDPFFRRLREQHPDVGIVMLPPEHTGDPGLPPATVGQCLAAQRHADAVLDVVAGRLGLETSSRIGFWWQQRHPLVRRWVVRTRFEGLGDEQRGDGSVDVLRSLGNLLLELRWDARPTGNQPPELTALAGPVRLVARAAPYAVGLQVVGQPFFLTEPVMAQLAELGAPA